MTDHTDCDVLIIGGGIAGAAAGYAITGDRKVILLERESQPGYHSTGRSAAWFTENYGNETIRRLVRAARPFLENPPEGFADTPLLRPGEELMVAPEDKVAELEAEFERARVFCPKLELLDAAEALRRHPALRPETAAAAMLDPDCADIDVAALHQGYLKGLRAQGGQVVCNAEVSALERRAGSWRATTRAGTFSAPVVINAAGAWADELAALAGVRPIGLVPKRRTVIAFDPPEGSDITGWPLLFNMDESWYVKPDAGRLLGSPADTTPSPPCDAQPEELDIATAAWRIEQATTLTVGKVTQSWAGLRSFVPDNTPVVGFAPDAEGFFWLAGQGGYGIKTSEPLGRLTAALTGGGEFPADLRGLGVGIGDLGPERLSD